MTETSSGWRMWGICQELGVPIAAHKTKGPSRQLIFLGIQSHSRQTNLHHCHGASVEGEKSCHEEGGKGGRRERGRAGERGREGREEGGREGREEGGRRRGTLSYVATVFPPGRTFLRRMVKTMKVPKCQHYHVRLNTEFQSDIQWWACFLPQWNGRSILPHLMQCTPSNLTRLARGAAVLSVTQHAGFRWNGQQS